MAQVPRGGEIIAGDGNHTSRTRPANHAVVVGASHEAAAVGRDGRMDLDQHPRRVPRPARRARAADLARRCSRTRTPTRWPSHCPRTTSAGRRPSRARRRRATPRGRRAHLQRRLWRSARRSRAARAGRLAPASACRRAWPAPSARSSSARRSFIWRARRARKLLGGGMRQVGVLAAPGLIALRDGPAGMIERLAEDHVNARRLADGHRRHARHRRPRPGRARARTSCSSG